MFSGVGLNAYEVRRIDMCWETLLVASDGLSKCKENGEFLEIGISSTPCKALRHEWKGVAPTSRESRPLQGRPEGDGRCRNRGCDQNPA
jgi:hypothetical protein